MFAKDKISWRQCEFKCRSRTSLQLQYELKQNFASTELKCSPCSMNEREIYMFHCYFVMSTKRQFGWKIKSSVTSEGFRDDQWPLSESTNRLFRNPLTVQALCVATRKDRKNLFKPFFVFCALFFKRHLMSSSVKCNKKVSEDLL